MFEPDNLRALVNRYSEVYIIGRETGKYVNWYKLIHIGRSATTNSEDEHRKENKPMCLSKPKPRPFEIGTVIVTNDLTDAMEDEQFKNFIYKSFLRYCANDWGDLDKATAKENKRNIKHGGNLGGRYIFDDGRVIVILTTAKRDKTIIAFERIMFDNELED